MSIFVRIAQVWVGLIFISVWCGTLWLAAPPNLNYSDTVAPSLWYAGDLIAPEGTLQKLIFPQLQILLPRILGGLNRWVGLPIELPHHILAVLFQFCGLGALALLALKISAARGWWAALVSSLALAVFLQSWITKIHVGYPVLIQYPNHLLGGWGLAASLLVWVLWLTSAKTLTRLVICSALTGLLFNLHATYGLIVLGIILCSTALDGLTSRSPLMALRAGLFGVLGFALGALPQLIILLRFVTAATPAVGLPDEAWWTLMSFRKPFHIYLWGTGGVIAPLCWIAVFWLAIVLALWRSIPAIQLLRLIATGIGVAVFCIVAYAAFAIVPTPALVGLVLTRAALIPLCAIPALIAAVAVISLRDWIAKCSTTNLLRFVFAAIACACQALPEAGPSVRTLSLAALLLNAALSFWSHARLAISPRLPQAIQASTAVFAAAALIVPFMLLPAKWQGTLALMPRHAGPAWNELMTYIRDTLPRDQIVLMPPYPYATISSRHINPTDYGYFGYSVYARNLVPFEIEQIDALFGVNLSNFTRETIKSYLADKGQILCLFEKGYVFLTSDLARLNQLRSLYPSMRYVVGVKPGTVPDEWTCGPAASRALALPSIFENEIYIMYQLPG